MQVAAGWCYAVLEAKYCKSDVVEEWVSRTAMQDGQVERKAKEDNRRRWESWLSCSIRVGMIVIPPSVRLAMPLFLHPGPKSSSDTVTGATLLPGSPSGGRRWCKDLLDGGSQDAVRNRCWAHLFSGRRDPIGWWELGFGPQRIASLAVLEIGDWGRGFAHS